MNTGFKIARACLLGGLLWIQTAQAQQAVVNEVGKDPFEGKTTEVLYKTPAGNWAFRSYGPAIIKATFRPTGYSKGENITQATSIATDAVDTKITAGRAPVIEWKNNTKVIIQGDRFYYKMGNEVRVKAFRSFSNEGQYGFRLQLTDGEHFYGGGERALPMERRGQQIPLYNTPASGYTSGTAALDLSIPLLLSSNGYAVFFDNASKGYLDIGKSDPAVLEASFTSGELTCYFIFGNNLDELLRGYLALTGRQPLPPRWAFGAVIARDNYGGIDKAHGAVNDMQKAHFPIDGLLLGPDWYGNKAGDLSWPVNSDWQSATDKIANWKKEDGLHTLLTLSPYIDQQSPAFAEARTYLAGSGATVGYAGGKGGLLNVFQEGAQDWFWKYYSKQSGDVAEGWHLLPGAPEIHAHDLTYSLSDQGVQRLLTAAEVNNLYAHYWNQLIAQKNKGKRYFELNASGFAGSQRYGVFPNTGSPAYTWQGLAAQVPALLSMNISGLPYAYTPAGGLTSADAELYTRWLQLAAFTPFFQLYSGAGPSEPCYLPTKYQAIARNYINLRYHLLPYNYSLAYQQAAFGKPFMRPLYYYDGAEAGTLAVSDCYYWGDGMLVAPVTQKGATGKTLYLPAGKWYNLYDNTVLEGGKETTVQAGIEQLPVLVKEGSFIPVWLPADTIHSTAAYDAYKDLGVCYYPGSTKTTYELFDDDGADPESLPKAQYEVLSFEGVTAGNKAQLKITTNNLNNYRRKTTRQMNILVPALKGVPVSVTVDGKAINISTTTGIYGTGNAGYAVIPVTFGGKPVTISFTLP